MQKCFTNANVSVKVLQNIYFKRIKWCFNNNNNKSFMYNQIDHT